MKLKAIGEKRWIKNKQKEKNEERRKVKLVKKKNWEKSREKQDKGNDIWMTSFFAESEGFLSESEGKMSGKESEKKRKKAREGQLLLG